MTSYNPAPFCNYMEGIHGPIEIIHTPELHRANQFLVVQACSGDAIGVYDHQLAASFDKDHTPAPPPTTTKKWWEESFK